MIESSENDESNQVWRGIQTIMRLPPITCNRIGKQVF